MIAVLKALLSRGRTPPPVRPDTKLHGLAVEALERLIEAWRACPTKMSGADAIPIILDICTREGLNEPEFFLLTNHFTTATDEFADAFWAAHLREAVPAGRA